MSKDIADRWGRAKLKGPGLVFVPDCEDPREDVKALLGKKAPPKKKAAKKTRKKVDE